MREAFGEPTRNVWANRAIGLAGDSLADPLFYFGAVGSAAFASGGSRALARVAASDTIKGTTTLRSALQVR